MCAGSIDGVHVCWDMCPSRLHVRHKGAKGTPTRSFNVTVDHHRMIRHVATSKPGSLNDKTTVRYDNHAMHVKNGKYREVRFGLYNAKGALREFKGGYLISDGESSCPHLRTNTPSLSLFHV